MSIARDAHERQRRRIGRQPRQRPAAAAGPCSASSARSRMTGRACTPAGRFVARWVKSSSLRLAFTTRNSLSLPRLATIRSSRMPPASLVSRRVALPAGLQADDVAGHQPFQRRGGGGAGQHRLAHVGDVEQRRLRAAVQVLGHHAAAAARGQVAGQVVLHRHGIAGEPDHARAQAAVPRVQRRGLQRLGGRVVGQGVLDHGPLRRQVIRSAMTPTRLTPLCRGT